METVFIQKIYKITEQILRGELSPEKARVELQLHLNKAQQLKQSLYEAEVLNTLAIVDQLQEDHTQAREHWEQMLVIGNQLAHEDLLTKGNSNLAQLMFSLYELDQALDYTQRGLKIVKASQQNKLSGLYLYSIETSVLVSLGRYLEAENDIKIFWTLADQTDLQKYSRYEYGQVIILAHNLSCQLALVSGDDARFHKHAQLFEELVGHLNLADPFGYQANEMVHHLLYAVLIAKDDAAALEWETKLRTLQGGQIKLSPLTNILEILWYTGRLSQAKNYAQQIIAHTGVVPKLYHYAQKVLDVEAI